MIRKPVNTFKKAIMEGRRQIGMWLCSTSPLIAELAATSGYDWLLFDAEHAPNDIGNILAQLQAVTGYDSHPVVRPPEGSTAVLKRLLDIGVQTILIPMVDTAEQAEELVRAMRYPPRGVRGVAASIVRASRWGRIPDYMRTADEDLCLLVQAETALALENLHEILKVDGIDGVFIGPADLSASLGHPGDPDHPEVVSAIKDSIAKIRASGKAAGIFNVDHEMSRKCLEWGATFAAVGADVMLYGQIMDSTLALYRDKK